MVSTESAPSVVATSPLLLAERGPVLVHVVEHDAGLVGPFPAAGLPGEGGAHVERGGGHVRDHAHQPDARLLRFAEQPQQRAPALAGAHVVHDVDVALQAT